MSKVLLTPTSRLICFGSAKACTNISVGKIREDNPVLGFDA